MTKKHDNIPARTCAMSLAHITLATRDVQASLNFFAEALGWRPIIRPGNIGRPAAWLEIAQWQSCNLVEVADFASSPFRARPRQDNNYRAIRLLTSDFGAPTMD